MHLIVECPCGQRMRVPAERRGRRGKCVTCGAVLPIDETTIRDAQPERASVASFESDGDPEPVPHTPLHLLREPAAPTAPEPQSQNPWADSNAPEQAMPDFTEPLHRADPWAPSRAEVREVRRDCCARCGREFRGEWDRHTRDEGIICNICANRADHVAIPPATAPPLPAGTVAPPTREELRAFRGLADKPPEPDPNRYRGLKPFLITFAVVMLAIVVLPVEDWIARLSERELNDTPETLAPVWHRVTWSMVLVFVFLKEWLAVFFGILSARPEGRDAFIVEATVAAKYALILGLFSFICVFALPPIFLVSVLAVLLPPLVLWAFTDLDGATVFMIFVFRAIVEPFMPMIKALIMGIIGILAT